MRAATLARPPSTPSMTIGRKGFVGLVRPSMSERAVLADCGVSAGGKSLGEIDVVEQVKARSSHLEVDEYQRCIP